MYRNKNIKDTYFLLFLAVLAIIAIISSVFVWFEAEPIQKTAQSQNVVKDLSGPKIREGVVDPVLSANSVFALDLGSGKVLYSKNSENPLLPASTTKMMTALVALDVYDINTVFTVGRVNVAGQKIGLVSGEQITTRDLLFALLLASGNDAAEVLASNHPEGRDGFVRDMNKFVKYLGLENTNFKNPTGFDEYLHFSTAKDLVKIAVYAIQNPVIAEIVATQQHTTAGLNRKQHKLTNINQLVGKIPGVVGVKTGWTINAGESLVTFINRDGRRVMISLLGSKDRFGETELLINWIYENYYW